MEGVMICRSLPMLYTPDAAMRKHMVRRNISIALNFKCLLSGMNVCRDKNHCNGVATCIAVT